MIRRRILPLSICAVLVLIAGVDCIHAVETAAPARKVDFLGPDSDRLVMSVGGFDVVREASKAGRLGPSLAGEVEYRVGQKYSFFGPLFGVLANANGGLLGYAGVYVDAVISRWIVTPFAAAGGYRRGEGKELGGLFVFYLGGTFAYRFENQTRLGVTLTHASNARAYDLNPGAESLLMSYAIPIGEGR